MNIETLISVYTVLAGLNILITQAVKKLIPDSVPSNFTALVCACVTGILGTIFYSQFIAPIPPNPVFYISVCVLIWLTSTHGYDKVLQWISQSKTIHE